MPTHNPGGQTEKVMKEAAQWETVPARKCRPRRRCELSAADIKSIVEAYTVEYIPQKEVARRFRVTEPLVSILVCEAKSKPEKLREKIAREQMDSRKQEAIQKTVLSMLKAGKVIANSKLVCQQVKVLYDLEVSERLA